MITMDGPFVQKRDENNYFVECDISRLQIINNRYIQIIINNIICVNFDFENNITEPIFNNIIHFWKYEIYHYCLTQPNGNRTNIIYDFNLIKISLTKLRFLKNELLKK